MATKTHRSKIHEHKSVNQAPLLYIKIKVTKESQVTAQIVLNN